MLAFQSVSAALLPLLLDRVARERPALRLALSQTTADPELFELLEAAELDITFAMLPVPDGPFAALELFADPFSQRATKRLIAKLEALGHSVSLQPTGA